MYSHVITITNIDYKEDIFLSLQSAGISQASSLEALNLKKALSDEFSLFTGFFKSASEREDEQIIITAVIESKDQAREFLNNLKTTGVDLKKQDILRMAVLPAVMAFTSDTGLFEGDF